MDDLTPVKGPASPLEGRSAKVIAVIVIAVLVAIVKPWGTETSAPPLARASTAPTTVAVTPRPGSPTPFDAFANYDHELFGVYEPEPRWELWPAGYLVSFGYAIRIGSASADASQPPSAPGASASATPERPVGSPVGSPAGSPGGSAVPGVDEPNWPATITIGNGNNLFVIGVNTPLGYRLATIAVARIRADGSEQSLPVVTPPSHWPGHFTIVGLADDTGRGAIENWPPGQYRLDLDIEPGGIVRSIAVVVSEPLPADEGSPAPTTAPVPSASVAP